MIVGQKVICVDDKFHPAVKFLYTSLPVKDNTYTIRGVEVGRSLETGEEGEITVLLAEMHNPHDSPPACRERGFKAERFRPIETQEETNELVESEPVKQSELVPI